MIVKCNEWNPMHLGRERTGSIAKFVNAAEHDWPLRTNCARGCQSAIQMAVSK